MHTGRVEVLLVVEDESGATALLRFLEDRGCHCFTLVSTHQLGNSLRDRELSAFDLVLSTTPLRQSDPLVRMLHGMKCKIFYRLPVEHGCWWVPLEGESHKRVGHPALRRTEFYQALEKMLHEMKLAKAHREATV